MKYLTTILFLSLASYAAAQDINLTGYTLVFEDNFDAPSWSTTGTTKGANKWYHLPPTGPAGNYSASTWDSNQISVSGGLLSLKAVFWSVDQRWYSGQISSMDTTGAGFAQKYGYFAAKVRMPNAGTGAWPAFWLLSKNAIPNNAGNRLEVDIFEWYGTTNTVAGGQKVQQVLHLWNPDNTDNQSINFGTIPGGEPVVNWHIYGVKVAPDFITWYIDGQQIWQIPTPTERHNDPLFIMVDYGLGGGWPLSGEPFASKGASTMLVDWVRAYSLPAAITVPPHTHTWDEILGKPLVFPSAPHTHQITTGPNSQ
jgi:beta-glucanase (GH16 family)